MTCIDCGTGISPTSQRCRSCSGKHRRNPNASKATKRARAARCTRVTGLCEHCKTRQATARHHPDLDNDPMRVILLCWTCHAAEDRRLGKWGRGGSLAGPKRSDSRSLSGATLEAVRAARDDESS